MSRNHAGLFVIYDQNNPEVFQAFERIALELLAKGVRRFGAKAIGEKIRYETAVRAALEPGMPRLKVNNNYWAYYARKLTMKDPSLWRGFFEFRDVPLEIPQVCHVNDVPQEG